jgi:hypothetical protein
MNENAMKPRIYADFQKGGKCYLILTCYGTLRDLSLHQIRLEKGMELTFYADSDVKEDLEVEGRVFYEPEIDGRKGHWSARYDWNSIRYVFMDHSLEVYNTHPCFRCRYDLHPYFAEHGRNEEMCCPVCGTSIMAPLLPPLT